MEQLKMQSDNGKLVNEIIDFLKSAEITRLYSLNNVGKVHADGVDVSTDADIEIERSFKNFISQKYPDHSVIGEEEASHQSGAKVWRIDPIDGSKYFAIGVPLWGTTISYSVDDICQLGIIFNPMTGQMYTAIKGQGAFLNDDKLTFNGFKPIEKSQLAYDHVQLNLPIHKLNQSLLDHINKYYRVRMLGSGVYSLAWLASGAFSAYVSPLRRKEKFVDVEAGLLIAAEAGAQVLIKDIDEHTHFICVGSADQLNYLEDQYSFLFE